MTATGGRRGLARIRQDIAADAPTSVSDSQEADETGETMVKLKDLKERFMEDSAFREEYARADEEYALVEAMVRARTTVRFTSSPEQVVVEDMEQAPRVEALQASASALGCRVALY